MCFKLAIEDLVENSKIAQEQLKKNRVSIGSTLAAIPQ